MIMQKKMMTLETVTAITGYLHKPSIIFCDSFFSSSQADVIVSVWINCVISKTLCNILKKF